MWPFYDLRGFVVWLNQFHTSQYKTSNDLGVFVWRSTQVLILTSRERPKSALYLRLKIVKGGPFGLCETPAC